VAGRNRQRIRRHWPIGGIEQKGVLPPLAQTEFAVEGTYCGLILIKPRIGKRDCGSRLSLACRHRGRGRVGCELRLAADVLADQLLLKRIVLSEIFKQKFVASRGLSSNPWGHGLPAEQDGGEWGSFQR
jgi:hypothetical protein